MDGTIVKLIAAGVIGAHGIGHSLGWIPLFGVRLEGLSQQSWLLTTIAGEAPTRIAAGLMFVIPTVGFVAAAAGLLTGQPWWRQVAVASAGMSLAASAVFPQAFSTSSTVGSVAVNVVVLYAVLVSRWGLDPVGG
jgi:hypothetical protein